jgi:hypothetical protein
MAYAQIHEHAGDRYTATVGCVSQVECKKRWVKKMIKKRKLKFKKVSADFYY